MKLLPSPRRLAESVDAPSAKRSEDQISVSFARSFWRSYIVGVPPRKRSQPVEKRGVTITITSSFTDSIFITSFINQTITTFITVEQNFTIPTTFSVPTTMTRNNTVTVTAPTTVTNTPSPATLGRVAPNLVVSQAPASSATLNTISVVYQGATVQTMTIPQTASPTPPAQVESNEHLSNGAIAGIVVGVLGFLGLLAAVFLLIRRFYRMYRRERVLRKQVQTEGNEMPAMRTGGSKPADDETERRRRLSGLSGTTLWRSGETAT